MAADVYCNTTTDLQAELPQIDSFDVKRRLSGFTLVSGIVYEAHDVGAVAVLFRDGEDLGAAQATAAAVNTDGEWHYDSGTDTLTLASTADPDSSHLIQAGQDTETERLRAVEWASALVRSAAGKPILKVEQSAYGSGFTWDPIITTVTARLACSKLVEAHNRELARQLREDCLAEDKVSGWLDMIRTGRIALSSDPTKGTQAGTVRRVVKDDASTGEIVEIRGAAVVDHDVIGIVITTGGILGKGTDSPVRYKVLVKGDVGLQTETLLSDQVASGGLCPLAYGVYCRFSTGVYTEDDSWDLEVNGQRPTAGGGAYMVEA